MVAGLQPGDALADLLDDPGALVPAHHREARHDVAVPQMLVGVAQARGRITDEHLARLGGSRSSSVTSKSWPTPRRDRSPGLH